MLEPVRDMRQKRTPCGQLKQALRSQIQKLSFFALELFFSQDALIT
jgi:hypothetical protein